MYFQGKLNQPAISGWLPQPKSFEVPVAIFQLGPQTLVPQLQAMVEASELASKAATTIVVDGKPVTGNDLSVRNCYTLATSVIAPGTEELFNRVAKSAWGNFEFHAKEPVGGQWQFLMYKPGGFFVTHYDDSRGHVFNGKNYAYRNTPERSMTLLIYLNDDYEGGEIEFVNIRQQDGQPLKIKPKAGTVVAFPSHELYAHRVLPTTSGTRYVVSRWYDDTSWLKVIEPTLNLTVSDSLGFRDGDSIDVEHTNGEIFVHNPIASAIWFRLKQQGLCHNHIIKSVNVKAIGTERGSVSRLDYETSVLLSNEPVQLFSTGLGGATKVETLQQFGASQHRLDSRLTPTIKNSLMLSFKSVRAYELSPEFRPISLLQ